MINSQGALLTDLYQLTMLEAFWRGQMREEAVFECYVRALPRERTFLMAAGLEQVLSYLETLRFDAEDLQWLAESRRFSREFLEWLETFRFRGDVFALPEGTVFFGNEPLVRIVAPLPEAQFVESRLINLLHYQTMIASKAARCVIAAPDKTLVDFGFRRAHGGEAGVLAARANYVAGFRGTATVAAGALYGIPLFGTMAHSYVQAHDSEVEAFRRFAHSQPDNVVLLIDTYDVEAGAQGVITLASELARDGIRIAAVRIDSGDLAEHARAVRARLDSADLRDIEIFVSGNLDEHRLTQLTRSGAPIDGYGIGTRLDTSADAPSLDAVYKLQEFRHTPRRKRSQGKATWPGRKQVFRNYGARQAMLGDVIGLELEDHPGHPLLRKYMEAGRRVIPPTPMSDIRAHASRELRSLPDALRSLDNPDEYPVRISDPIVALAEAADAASRP